MIPPMASREAAAVGTPLLRGGRPPRTWDISAVAAIVLITLVVFYPVTRNGFLVLAFDDIDAVVLPVNLSPIYYYPREVIYHPVNFLALALIPALCVYVTVYRRRFPWSFVCLWWFVLALLPESNLVPLAQLRPIVSCTSHSPLLRSGCPLAGSGWCKRR
jgi:hypothetical protein